MGVQSQLGTEWAQRLGELAPETAAASLYAGRAFRLAAQVAEESQASFYILSAGLGIVPALRRVPAYALTVTGSAAESIKSRAIGPFDATAWFALLLNTPYSDQWSTVAGRTDGRVLIALTQPYAEMVGTSLARLPSLARDRLRIFGAGLAEALPAELTETIVPYDARLDTIFPGTRSDFAQRAMLHFAKFVLPLRGQRDRSGDHEAVQNTLNTIEAPAWPKRPRRSDEEIIQLLVDRMRDQAGAGKLLRALRDGEGVACEQARFGRLYREAKQRSNAA